MKCLVCGNNLTGYRCQRCGYLHYEDAVDSEESRRIKLQQAREYRVQKLQGVETEVLVHSWDLQGLEAPRKVQEEFVSLPSPDPNHPEDIAWGEESYASARSIWNKDWQSRTVVINLRIRKKEFPEKKITVEVPASWHRFDWRVGTSIDRDGNLLVHLGEPGDENNCSGIMCSLFEEMQK